MKNNRILRTLLCLLTVGLLLAYPVTVACGAEEEKGSITLKFSLEDFEFSLYRVGDITSKGAVCTEKFADYNVDLYSENAAETLSSYIERDNIEPLSAQKTDANCETTFEGLSKGVYLTTGEYTTVDGLVYMIMPSLISLPSPSDEGELWDVTSYVKYGCGSSEATSISVVKVWKNDTKQTHPAIKVQLLENGEVYDTVTLSKENNWKHTWEYLYKWSDWKVVEAEPLGDYSVDVSRNETVFTVTNTKKSETAPEDRETDSSQKTRAMIPQTGQLNWPIPVLAFSGVVLIIVGVAMLRKKRDEK